MKVFMIMFSLMFVSCVTAKPRDLSAVNPSPAVVSADNQFEGCLSDCTKRGGLLVFCSDSCLKLTKVENKKPLMLADDYSECMDDCESSGGSSEVCDEICEQRTPIYN